LLQSKKRNTGQNKAKKQISRVFRGPKKGFTKYPKNLGYFFYAYKRFKGDLRAFNIVTISNYSA